MAWKASGDGRYSLREGKSGLLAVRCESCKKVLLEKQGVEVLVRSQGAARAAVLLAADLLHHDRLCPARLRDKMRLLSPMPVSYGTRFQTEERGGRK